MIKTLKNRYIKKLQMYTNWGKSNRELEKEAEAIFNLIPFSDLENVEDLKCSFKRKPKTTLLKNTNIIDSPLNLNYTLELPLVELFLDKDNFVVFTTQGIYNNRNSVIEKIDYSNLSDIDEDSLFNFFLNRRKGNKFRDIELVTFDRRRIVITFEDGLTVNLIISFLAMLIRQNNLKY